MSRWMLELSEKERERRAKFSAFMKAVPGFIAALAQELKLGADAYNEQFPDENSVDVNRMPGGRIQVICSGRDGLRSAAIVTLNADTQRVACSFENIQHVNWEDILDVAGDASSLHSIGDWASPHHRELGAENTDPSSLPRPPERSDGSSISESLVWPFAKSSTATASSGGIPPTANRTSRAALSWGPLIPKV
jgi:hypothetical protein